MRPSQIFRRLEMAETFVGIGERIEKCRDFRNFIENSGHETLRLGGMLGLAGVKEVYPVSVERQIDMQAAARLIEERFRHKGGMKTVLCCHRLDHHLEGGQIVRRGKGSVVFEVDLILSRAGFVVGAFGLDAHLLKGKADFPPDVFPFIPGSDITVSAPIVGNSGWVALFVGLEEIEFAFRADFADIAHLCRMLDRSAEHGAPTALERSAIGGI